MQSKAKKKNDQLGQTPQVQKRIGQQQRAIQEKQMMQREALRARAA